MRNALAAENKFVAVKRPAAAVGKLKYVTLTAAIKEIIEFHPLRGAAADKNQQAVAVLLPAQVVINDARAETDDVFAVIDDGVKPVAFVPDVNVPAVAVKVVVPLAAAENVVAVLSVQGVVAAVAVQNVVKLCAGFVVVFVRLA